MTQDELFSTLRSTGIFVVGAAAGTGLMAATTATSIQTDIGHMMNGAQEFMLGAGPLIALALAWWGKNKASLVSQVSTVQAAAPGALMDAVQAVHPKVLLAATAALTDVKSIVTTQAVADSTPSEKIVGPPKATGEK